jgi:hypothetical protein
MRSVYGGAYLERALSKRKHGLYSGPVPLVRRVYGRPVTSYIFEGVPLLNTVGVYQCSRRLGSSSPPNQGSIVFKPLLGSPRL